MRYIECPDVYEGNEKSLFLAGGITNCPNWQLELVSLLKDEDITLLNPRRKNFPINDSKAAEEQIKWEYKHLRKADAISFWFPKETLCPICLYELGTWSITSKPLFIGTHLEYQRKKDLEIQNRLVRPDIEITYNLKSLSAQIKRWIRS